MNYCYYDSPLGRLLLTEEGGCLTGLRMDAAAPAHASMADAPVLAQTRSWLDSYFRGEKPTLEIPLSPEGSAFQRLVWQELLTIPYGETRTYGETAKAVAAQLGRERMSAQAVGGAVGRNPISILIPCHRVVGTGGQLTGYAWGLDRKAWLLRHEAMSSTVKALP